MGYWPRLAGRLGGQLGPGSIFVRGNRFLSYLNYVIGLALVAGAGAFYWYAWRPQAAATGSTNVGVSAPVTVARDVRGVPSIEARSLDDLFFAQGYVHAQDRLFQLDLTRRQASGELAEILGQGSLASDLEARRLGLRRLAQAHAAALDPESRRALAAYARGINRFIETHANNLPLEFTVLRYAPAPWTITDSMTVAMGMARMLTESWPTEVLKQNMLQSGEREMVDYLFPARSGTEPQLGSNAWVVSGKHTKSGKPILANDPHLPLTLPSLWYQNELRAPGFHATGVSLPGIPAVVIGRNDRIAWGITNLQFDVQDLYAEPAATPIANLSESIRVRGGTVVSNTVRATPHGVLMDTVPPLALRWNAAEPGGASFALLPLNRASNWADFRAALANWTVPAQNFVYADNEGNIGYQAAGRLPKRTRLGDLPVDGSNPANEWQGYIPFEDLPSSFNPPSGRIVSANQNPFPVNYPYPVHGNFAPPDRANQIAARLEAKSQLTAADMLRLQRDLYSQFHHFLARQFAAAAKPRTASNQQLATVVDALAAWNGQMSAGSSAALVTALGWQHLRQAIAERAAPGQAARYDIPLSTAVAQRLLTERPAKWFSSYDDLLMRALVEAIRDAEKQQGANPANWSLGANQKLALTSPVLARVPYFNRIFASWLQVGPVGLGGSSTTIHQRTARGGQIVGPSMRMVVDWGNPEDSILNLSTGQSGQAFSPHFTDQWAAYQGGTSFPFGKQESQDTLTLVP